MPGPAVRTGSRVTRRGTAGGRRRRRDTAPYTPTRQRVAPSRPVAPVAPVATVQTSPRLTHLLNRASTLLANRPSEDLLRGDSTDLLGRPSSSPIGEHYASVLEHVARKIKAETDRIERKASLRLRTGQSAAPAGPRGTVQGTRIGPNLSLFGETDTAGRQKRKQVRGAKATRAVHAGRATADALLNEAGQARSPDPTTKNDLITAATIGSLPFAPEARVAAGIGARLAGGVVKRGAVRGAEAIAERAPALARGAKGAATVARRGWASTPVRAARTGARVGSAPVRVPTRYLGRHPGQSFAASTGAVGAVAAAESGNPADLALAPLRVIGTTGAATRENPGGVGLTTLRTVPAMATALAKLPGDVALAATGHPQALKGLAVSQLEYLKQIKAVAENKPYTEEYTDARGVHHKVTLSPKELIEKNLGFVPLISEGLVAGRALRGRGVTPRSLAEATPGVRRATRSNRIARLQAQLDSPEHATRTKAAEKLNEMGGGRLANRKLRSREARRAAGTEEAARSQFARELKANGKLHRQIEHLSQRHVATITRPDGKKVEVSAGDLAQVIGREGAHGLKSVDEIRSWAHKTRNELQDVASRRTLDPNVIATRDVLATIEQHPEIVRDPALQKFLTDWGEMQRQRSIERHSERTGKKETTPDPEDLRAQYMHQARAEGEHLPEERVPHELRGVSRHTPKRGVDAEKAIRGEARQARQRAKKLRGEAEGHETAARGAVRELNVRRVADKRRAGVRSKEKGLAKLEARRDAWQKKLDEFEKPVNEPLHQAGNAPRSAIEQTRQKAIRAADEAPKGRRTQQREAARKKIADLDRQIRERRARLDEMPASPAAERNVKRVSESKGRAEELRAQADAEEARAAQLESVVNRKKRATAMEVQALRAEDAGDLQAANSLRSQAQALRREHNASQERLRTEFHQGAEAARRRAGKAEPIWFKEVDAADRGNLNVLSQYSAGRLPKKEQRRIGTLAAQGRIDEAVGTLFDNAYRDRVTAEMRTHQQNFVKEHLGEFGDDGRLIHTGPEQRKFERDGIVPPGMAAIPVQEFNRAFQRGSWDEASGLIDNAIARDVRELKGRQGRKFGIVPKAALEEFRDQMTAWNKGLRWARTLGRVQSLGLLALSPAWFGFQLIASPLAAAVAHPNPLAWARATQRYFNEFRDIPEADRIAFSSHFGGTSAEALTTHNVRIGLQPGTVAQMTKAARIANHSPVGRIGHAILDNLRNGGPLIKANRAYEAKIRDFVALMESEKLSRAAQAKVMEFGAGTTHLHDIVTRQMAELEHKPLDEQLRFYEETPRAEAELTQAMTDSLGDWNGITKMERVPAAATVFYPFLRFSLRWLFHSMPRNHPLTTTVLLNLSQRNAQEIEQLLGGAPSFFPDWGNVILHSGPNGEPGIGLDMGRAAPGSNAILEAMGQGGFNLSTLAAPFQPWVKAALTAAAGQDPLTGRESNRSKGEIFARQIVGLPPPLRPFAGDIGGNSAYSELFSKIMGRPESKLGGIGHALAPDPLVDPRREAEARRLSQLLNVAFGSDNSDEAQTAKEEIDKLFQKYGIDHSATGASGSSGGSSSSGGWAGSSGGSSSSRGGW